MLQIKSWYFITSNMYLIETLKLLNETINLLKNIKYFQLRSVIIQLLLKMYYFIIQTANLFIYLF